MADLEKQPHTRKYRRGGCCSCCLTLLLKIILAAVILLGLAIVIFVIIVNPHKMKFRASDAFLTEFNLTAGGDTLAYNLRLNLTVRNPNKKIGFHYEVGQANAYYKGKKFGSGNLLSFYQPPKTTSVVDAWFSGIQRLSLGDDEVEEYEERKKSSGVYSVDVKIQYYSSIKLDKMHIGDFKVKIKCRFKVPLSSTGNRKRSSGSSSTTSGFKTTRCNVDFNPFIVIYTD